ncbi:MAG: hypothetical protein ACKVYV_19125 [Limisphaerales bacterium]
MKNRLQIASAAVVLVAFAVQRADAALILTIQPSGSDVVVSGSGSLNLGAASPGNEPLPIEGNLWPVGGFFAVGPHMHGYDFYDIVAVGPSSFGTGPGTPASTGTGDTFGLSFTDRRIFLPEGYGSAGPLSGTSTYEDRTLDSLGLAPGTYQWTTEASDGLGGVVQDSITLNVVPEPGAFGVCAAAGALGFAMMRRGLPGKG